MTNLAKYRLRRREGLCVRCPNPPRKARKGKSMCDEHQRQRNAYLRQRHTLMMKALNTQRQKEK